MCKFPYALSILRINAEHTLSLTNSNVCMIHLPREADRNLVPMVFIRTGYIGTCCLEHTKIPGSQKESRCLAQTVLFTQLRHSQPLLSVKVVGTLPKSKFPDSMPILKQQHFKGYQSSLLDFLFSRKAPFSFLQLSIMYVSCSFFFFKLGLQSSS